MATYDGLRSFFSGYKFKLNFSDFLDKHFSLDSAMRVHFRSVSRQMGYEILPQENLVNEIANAAMKPDQYIRAYRLFRMNVENYPDSIPALEAMKDYYIKMNDRVNAEEYSKRIAILIKKATSF